MKLTSALALTAMLALTTVSYAQPDEPETEEEATEPEQTEETEAPAEKAEEATKAEPAEEPEPAADDKEAVAADAAAAKPNADEAQADAEKEDEYPRFDFGGYIRPGFGFRVRPDALPKDELDYGFLGLAGLTMEAWPLRMWRAKLNVELDAFAVSDVATDITFRLDNETTFNEVDLTPILIQEATAAFVPTEWFELKAGVTRIPFSLQQQSKNTQTMFPNRSPANNVFLSGADIGAIASGDFADGIFVTSLGVFNGNSLGLTRQNLEKRFVASSFRADVNPFGEFTHSGEGDLKRGPFRLGAGFGLVFTPATLFDERTGTEPRSVYDLRLAASLRMAVSGVYLAAEYFRRQQTDNFSSRPEVADGAYAQLGVFFLLNDYIGLEPLVRAGFVADDQSFDPRLTGNIDGGFNFYPAADHEVPDTVKLTVLYLGERRFSESEEAHGGAITLLLRF